MEKTIGGSTFFVGIYGNGLKSPVLLVNINPTQLPTNTNFAFQFFVTFSVVVWLGLKSGFFCACWKRFNYKRSVKVSIFNEKCLLMVGKLCSKYKFATLTVEYLA